MVSARSGHPLGLPESAAAAGAAAHARFRLSGWDWLLQELSPSTVNLLTNHVHPSGTGGGRSWMLRGGTQIHAMRIGCSSCNKLPQT